MSAVAITTFLAGVGSVVVCGIIVVPCIAIIAGTGVALFAGIATLVSAGCK
jgi:hypothetical protein